MDMSDHLSGRGQDFGLVIDSSGDAAKNIKSQELPEPSEDSKARHVEDLDVRSGILVEVLVWERSRLKSKENSFNKV